MVNREVCRKCQHSSCIHANTLICEYLLDENKMPAGVTVKGVWKRLANGDNCPEFLAGKARNRKAMKMYIPDRSHSAYDYAV